MAEKVDAWMPLHIGAYMAATGHLSVHEHGMYILLLMHAWANGGELPGDDERIRRICRADPRDWQRSRDVIIGFLTPQADGTYRQKRLDAELTKASDLKETKSAAGKKGAAQRWQSYGKRMAEPMAQPQAEPMAKPMAKPCPVPPPEPEPAASQPNPPGVDGGDRDRALEIASLCIVNRVSGATRDNPYVQQWASEGVTDDQIRAALAEARISKPMPDLIPIRYILPIVERVKRNGGKVVDNSWKTDDRAAEKLCRELGIPGARVNEQRPDWHVRINRALLDRARSQVA